MIYFKWLHKVLSVISLQNVFNNVLFHIETATTFVILAPIISVVYFTTKFKFPHRFSYNKTRLSGINIKGL